MDTVRLFVIGIGGYGQTYMSALLDKSHTLPVSLCGVCDPYPKQSRYYEKLVEQSIPIYSQPQDFFKAHNADLTIISSPIAYHKEQTIAALNQKSHVLVEKPPAAKVCDVDAMISHSERANRFVSVGYQWSHHPSMHAFKRDVLQGRYGKPIDFRTLVCWPRTHDYFNRSWAGKKKDESGRFILDSVANNAAAHYLHNMFYIAGADMIKSAKLDTVTAELYKANDIETFDTAAIRAYSDEEVSFSFYATHACDTVIDPRFRYEFEKAVVWYDGAGDACITAVCHDGTTVRYGQPNDRQDAKLATAVYAALGQGELFCTLDTARSHTVCINAAHESMPCTLSFDPSDVVIDFSKKLTYVKGLAEQWKNCYEKGVMPSQTDIKGAKPGKKIDVRGYDRYKMSNT